MTTVDLDTPNPGVCGHLSFENSAPSGICSFFSNPDWTSRGTRVCCWDACETGHASVIAEWPIAAMRKIGGGGKSAGDTSTQRRRGADRERLQWS